MAKPAADRLTIAKASGDEDLQLEARHKITQLTQKYADFSKQAGLPAYAERTRVTKAGRVATQAKVKSTVAKSGESGIINKRGNGTMNIIVDKFTPCLEEVASGKIIQTSYSMAETSELKQLKGWKFNWLDNSLNDSDIFKLCLEKDSEIQGLVALTEYKRDRSIYVNIAESAPHNLGRDKRYSGVGGHLFAIAAKHSVDLGYGGFVFMDAKNVELIDHYKRALGAIHIGGVHPYRMIIDEEQASKLIRRYTLKEE